MRESAMKELPELLPWYKQFWPWFIILLPAVVVVAGLVTLVIAINNADSLVADDYYQQGLTINRVLAEDDMAGKLRLTATMDVDELVGEIDVWVGGKNAPAAKALTLQWIHPADKDKDFSLTLKRSAAGHYRGQMPARRTGRWYLQLTGDVPKPWRLRAEINLDDRKHFVFD